MSDYDQPVLLGAPEGEQRGKIIADGLGLPIAPPIDAEADTLVDGILNDARSKNVVPIGRNAWKSREKTLRAMARQSRTVVKGGARVVKFNVSMPADQYDKLMARFAGDTPSDKINTLARIANDRIDRVQNEQAAKQRAEFDAARMTVETPEPA